MKRSFLAVIFLITIVTSVLASAVMLRLVFPELVSKYGLLAPSGGVAPIVFSGSTASLKQVETGVKAIAKKMQPSVVNIIINKDIQLYRTDPY